MIDIALTSASLPAKHRILSACVRLFLEKGYRHATLAEIIERSDVSYSTFQNIFRAKDGVLTELTEFMFSNQFSAAASVTGAPLTPVQLYAVETSLQLTLTELNENLREIYLEAYNHPDTLAIIHRKTAAELYRIFGAYRPERTERDFLLLEFGSAGLMRGYMAQRCSADLPLETKLRAFLTLSLSAYRVPEAEQASALAVVMGLDLRALAQRVLHQLFQALSMRYDFSLTGIEEVVSTEESEGKR